MEDPKPTFPLKPPYVLRLPDGGLRLAVEGGGSELSEAMRVSPEEARALGVPQIWYETCLHCGDPVPWNENYVVHDEVWSRSGVERYHGILHFACLEQRTGGHLDPVEVMPAHIPLNRFLLEMYFRGKEA